MPNMTDNERLQQAFTATIATQAKNIVDLFASYNPIFGLLKSKGRYEAMEGHTLQQPIRVGENPNIGSFSGYDILPNSPYTLLNQAEFKPKHYYAGFSLARTDVMMNKGNGARYNLMKNYAEKTKTDFMKHLDRDIYGDGTGNGGKNIAGFAAMLPKVNNTGVYGAIDRATYTAWRPGSYNLHNYEGGGAVTKDNILKRLHSIGIRHKTDMGGFDTALFSNDLYELLFDALDERQRITDNGGKLANIGFTTIRVNIGGKMIEVLNMGGLNSNFPDNTIYLIKSDTMSLKYFSERNFTVLDNSLIPLNQDAFVQRMFWSGCFYMEDPLQNAIVYNDVA